MSKAIIISGGELEEGFVEKVLSENEGASIVGVDKGVEYLYHHQIKPLRQRLLNIIKQRLMWQLGNIIL